MEAQIKRALRANFITKKKKKNQTKIQALHDIFFNPPITTVIFQDTTSPISMDSLRIYFSPK